jgi:hypothetical protein
MFHLAKDAPELATILQERYYLYPREFLFTRYKKYQRMNLFFQYKY